MSLCNAALTSLAHFAKKDSEMIRSDTHTAAYALVLLLFSCVMPGLGN